MRIKKNKAGNRVLKSFEDLNKEYEMTLALVQKACKHEEISDWCDEWWAIGHSTGRRVKHCLHCRKRVEVDESALYNMRKQQLKNNKHWKKHMTKEECDEYVKTGKWPSNLSKRLKQSK